MNKKITVGATIAITAIVAAITFAITWSISTNLFSGILSETGSAGRVYSKLSEIDGYVQSNYIGDLDEQQIETDVAIGYMAGTGDPYAAYYTPEQWKEQQEQNAGVVCGIGISAKADQQSGYILIVSVYDNSPASEAGLQPGDLLVNVDGNDLQGKSLDDAISMIQGNAGTTVSVTTRRDGVDTTNVMTRREVEIPAVSWHMDGDNGYIQINSFTSSGAEQFLQALDELTAQGAKGLIFDLRGNGGGTIDSVCKMLDPLLPEGVIATEVTADGSEDVLGTSDANEISLPMVTITNGQTASASELFVCDLKDYGKAKQVGTTTYGKGVLQTTKPLSDGSAIKVTTAQFNAAKSPNFDGVGLTPDEEVNLTEDQQAEQLAGTLPLDQDPQYQKAVEVLNAMK